jgi:8-oxo-dGTP diphosphatase
MKEVTAAIITKGKNVLISRRAPGESLEGKWEFAGGKVEFGESPEECLQRELLRKAPVQQLDTKTNDRKMSNFK